MSNLAVIFDMDGVLIDSVSLNWQAYNQVLLENYGFQVDSKDLYKYVGMALHDQISLIGHDFAVIIDGADFERKSTQIKQALFQNVQPKQGVVRLLAELNEAKIPTALATSSPQSIARERLTKANIWDCFEAHVTEENVNNHKPHPDVYIEAAKELRISTAKCVVIEDAPKGIESAKRAGMLCVAVTTPYVLTQDLHEADLIVSSLDEINIEILSTLIA